MSTSLSLKQAVMMTLAVTMTVAMAGCAVGGGRSDATVAPAEAACMSLLKDMRQHCRQGIRDSRAPLGFDCLSARLEFEQRCQ